MSQPVSGATLSPHIQTPATQTPATQTPASHVPVLQIDDLVYDYPDQDSPGFQTAITAKEEFRELAAQIKEAAPKRGQFYKHQTFIHRFMNVYNYALLIHRTGTGKTGAAAGFAESLKRSYIEGAMDFIELYMLPRKTHIRHVYILARGPAVIDVFKDQIVCRYSVPGSYETPLIMNAKTDTQRKTNITNELKKYYSIITFGEFVKNIVQKDYSDDQIRKDYSGCLFIVDEAHNLRIDLAKGEKIKTQKRNYQTLHRVFHLAERSKVMLMTATPMVNHSGEIGSLMNLILPLNMQMPTDRNFYLTATAEQMEPYFRGRISYIRELDTSAEVVYKGTPIEAQYNFNGKTYKSQKIVWGSEMSGPVQIPGTDIVIPGQNSGYLQVATPGKDLPVVLDEVDENEGLDEEIGVNVGADEGDNISADETRRRAFHEKERQASNFVGPDGSSGKLFFDRYISQERRMGTEVALPDRFVDSPELAPFLKDLNWLRVLSSKFHDIFVLSNQAPGNVFIYFDFKRGSGAIVQGLVFEEQGYERFYRETSIFSPEKRDPGGLRPLCPPEAPEGASIKVPVERPTNIPKNPKRYALLIPETSDPAQRIILETFNSYENRHGDYIKVLIVTPAGREGISVASVIQMHLAGPGWNPASDYQAESRVLRATSHDWLIEEERAKLIARGEDPKKAKVTVEIYQHAAFSPGGHSIDIQTYQLSERKDIEIKRVMRIMKRCAVDCQINYDRNVRVNETQGGLKDVDGSAICDYDVCQYSCIDPAPSKIDYSSFDVLYSRPLIDKAKEEIMSLFSTHFSLTFQDIYETIGRNIKTKFIDFAIEELISQKVAILDRYGYPNFLREDSGTLFLQRDYPLITPQSIKPQYALNIYTRDLIGVELEELTKYVALINFEEQKALIEHLQTIPVNNPQFNEIIERLSPETRILLLETSLYQWFINRIESPQIVSIISRYRDLIFTFNDPIAEIKAAAQLAATTGQGRGRRPKAVGLVTPLTSVPSSLASSVESLPSVETGEVSIELGETEPSVGEDVIIHTLYSQIIDKVSYGVTAASNKAPTRTRVLKRSEGTWRDANKYELTVYNQIIKDEIKSKTDPYEQFPIYGTLIRADGKFRIRNKLMEDTEAAKKDKRHENRGRVCKDYDIPVLITFVWHLGIPAPNIQVNLTREQIMANLREKKVGSKKEPLESFTDDKLRYYQAWLFSKTGKKQYCDMLFNELQRTNRLLVI